MVARTCRLATPPENFKKPENPDFKDMEFVQAQELVVDSINPLINKEVQHG